MTERPDKSVQQTRGSGHIGFAARCTSVGPAWLSLRRSAEKFNSYKWFATLLLLISFSPISIHARFVRELDMQTLIRSSQLVFAGQVKSVKRSGIITELTYLTWEGAVFEWLTVEVNVIEPIKGTKKGQVVQTVMLSTRGSGPIMNSPGMVDPKVGQRHLLCLLPTRIKGTYASITAPFDDNRGIFLLDRRRWVEGATYYKDGKKVAFHEQCEKNWILWNVVDDEGEIKHDGLEYLRKKYETEIASPPPKDAVIHLKWRKETSASIWQWSVPDENRDSDKSEKKESGWSDHQAMRTSVLLFLDARARQFFGPRT